MKKDSLKAILFLLWFFASIIALIYFSKINGYYTFMIFGQYFLVFGSIFMFAGKGIKRLVSIIPILIGLACIIIPFLMLHPELLGININWNIVIPCLILLAFLAAGIFMATFSYFHHIYLKKVCTLEINATVSEKEVVNYGDMLYLFRTEYSFQYNNKSYKVSYMTPKREDDGPKGTIVRIKIDPNNPNNFLYNYPIDYILIIMGIFFIAVASFALYLLYNY